MKRVVATKLYYDADMCRRVTTGDEFTVTDERFKVLSKLSLVEEVKQSMPEVKKLKASNLENRRTSVFYFTLFYWLQRIKNNDKSHTERVGIQNLWRKIEWNGLNQFWKVQ